MGERHPCAFGVECDRSCNNRGDNDEWVVSTTAGEYSAGLVVRDGTPSCSDESCIEGDIIIWEVGSSWPRQVVKAPPSKGANYNPMTVYCPGHDDNGPVVLLYGHSDQEVIVWNWWNKSSKRIDVATPPRSLVSFFSLFGDLLTLGDV